MKRFHFYPQHDSMDCGPACLRMIVRYYGKKVSLQYLRNKSFINRTGVNLVGLSEAAEQIGLRTLPVKVTLDKLKQHDAFPCIIHWNQSHFIVLYKVKGRYVYLADPGAGLRRITIESFLESWTGKADKGIALLVEPTPEFFEEQPVEGKDEHIQQLQFLTRYLRPYKIYLVQILLSMIAASGLSLLLPFLTQNMVDRGINEKNLGIVKLILIAQIATFIGSSAIEIVRSWVMLHLNSRINISIISDFLMKLMKLPIRYFDTKLIGDLRQRIGDHSRIQNFLTGSALSTFFSMINLVVFTVVLAIYNLQILLVFMGLSLIGILWILFFMKRRKELDYIRFQRMSENDNILYEMITGMQEIKLNNCEKQKRWAWERVQARLFHFNIKSLSLSQYQQLGASFINQFKNILVSYIAAKSVINGHITLGMMMSIGYITGQLNSPIQMLLSFIQSAQDAKISLDRLGEIHNKPDEESEMQLVPETFHSSKTGIVLINTSYQYTGPKSPFVLKDLNLTIPLGKVTAIVGSSGSGKTTLMKMLLNFYEPVAGEIRINGSLLQSLPPSFWREHYGIVMQEGYIFSDTIANNIAMSDQDPDEIKLKHAANIANIGSFIDELPMGYQTMIGNAGVGISTGQKQRILIARAAYKNPEFIFLDEATSALDANNEKIIMENLQEFYSGKTVVVIAHRLSTVKNADQIIVLEKGEVAEVGNHYTLLDKKGKYFTLFQNQLEKLYL